MSYYAEFVKAAYVKKQLMSNDETEWFETYGLALYLFSDNNSDTPKIDKSKAVKKYQSQYHKKISKNNTPAVELDYIQRLVSQSKSFEGYNQIFIDYEFPCCELRAIELVEVLKALGQKNIDEALLALEQLSEDFLIQNSFWGGIVTFIVAANSGDYDDAKLHMLLVMQYLQNFWCEEFFYYLVPYLVKTHLPEEHWLWQFKNIELEHDGEVYYGMPIMAHNSIAEDGADGSVSWIELKQSYSTHLEDAMGNKYHSVMTLTSNTILNGVNLVSNLAGNALLQSAGLVYRMVTNGKFKVITPHGLKTLVLEKNTELPNNSNGYLLTKNKNDIERWLDPNNNQSIKEHDCFFNVTNGKAYKSRKGNDFFNSSDILNLLNEKIYN